MSKYIYRIFEIHELDPNLNSKFNGGIVADIIGGLEDERLVVVGYEIVEDEDDRNSSDAFVGF